jgi:hypothetical protein
MANDTSGGIQSHQTSAHDPLSALVARDPGGVWGERKKGTKPSRAKAAAIRLRRIRNQMRQECTTWRLDTVSDNAQPFSLSKRIGGAMLSSGSAYGIRLS